MKSPGFSILFLLLLAGNSMGITMEDVQEMTAGKKDTRRFLILDSLARVYRNTDPAFALEILKISVPLAKSQDGKNKQYYPKELILLCKVNRSLSFFSEAIANAREATKVFLELGDTLNASEGMTQMGSTYYIIGSYDLAIKHYFESLKIGRKYNSPETIAVALTNMGNIFVARENYNKALEYYLKALPVFNKEKDKSRYVLMLDNISLVYLKKQEFKKALFYNSNALALIDSVKMRYDYSNILMNGGSIYSDMGDFQTSLDYFHKALRIAEELQNGPSATLANMNIGFSLLQLSRYNESLEYLNKALEGGKELELAVYICLTYQNLSQVYEKMGDIPKAYMYFNKYVQLSDSVFSAESRSETNDMITRYETEQQEKEVELLEQQNELKAQLLQRDGILLYASSGAGLSLVVLAIVLLSSSRNKKKANGLMKSRNHEIQNQKQIIEEKNKDITDSINYAKRIQQSILPDKRDIEAVFPNSFVLFKPKDVVSGDFYWLAKKGEKIVLAVADCTGHGVPGALMSMIGSTLLNEIVNNKNITEAADILFHLREGIIRSLKQTGASGESKDGMDIALCTLDTSTNHLQFSGANNAMYHVRKNELTKLKADKQPIGIYSGEAQPFSQTQIALQKGDSIYLFTDGFADQFGGMRGKKFKYKALEELIRCCSGMPASQQLEEIEAVFTAWKGKLEQVDDVCLVGIKI